MVGPVIYGWVLGRTGSGPWIPEPNWGQLNQKTLTATGWRTLMASLALFTASISWSLRFASVAVTASFSFLTRTISSVVFLCSTKKYFTHEKIFFTQFDIFQRFYNHKKCLSPYAQSIGSHAYIDITHFRSTSGRILNLNISGMENAYWPCDLTLFC